MTNDKIEKKKVEIEEYKKLVIKYSRTRWYNMGITKLESLERELAELIEQAKEHEED